MLTSFHLFGVAANLAWCEKMIGTVLMLVGNAPVAAIATLIFLYVVSSTWSFLNATDSGRMDAATSAFLTGKVDIPTECKNLVEAVESSAPDVPEEECAEQIRAIVVAKHIPYKSLIEAPERILRCSQGIATNGGLWTRFTVQYNLFAGSIVAVGSDEQRAALVAMQDKGVLGCFAFTEKGAGVLSGAGVETTATLDPKTDEFVITSPTPSSVKNWISQGLYAEHAVILAELIVGGESKGPHLFWAPIAERKARGPGRPTPLPGVTVESLPEKTAMRGLDNAAITFTDFRIPRTALLNRFCRLDKSGAYATELPKGVPRMLDLLLLRLLTGRIQLSEGTIAHALTRLRHSWAYCRERELWRGRKPEGKKMSEMPLVASAFRDYGRCLGIINAFIADTREVVADSIRNDAFTYDTVEATCMCKYLGTGFGLDAVSATRKVMGARALQEGSMLGAESFLPNATCAAEGDNTVMELKVVQDLVRGRTQMLPLGLLARSMGDARGRRAVFHYLTRLAKATYLGKRALSEGQLLRDVAWSRTHLRVIDVWRTRAPAGKGNAEWLDSYERIMMRYPSPLQC